MLPPTIRETLYLDLALEGAVRAAAERGAGASGTAAAAFIGPLLQVRGRLGRRAGGRAGAGLGRREGKGRRRVAGAGAVHDAPLVVGSTRRRKKERKKERQLLFLRPPAPPRRTLRCPRRTMRRCATA